MVLLVMALSYAHGAIQWLAASTVGTVYTVSGLPFQPKALRCYMIGIASATDALSTALNSQRSVGFGTSTSDRRSIATWNAVGAGSAEGSCIVRNDAIVCPINKTVTEGLLDLNSLTSDGFTLIVDDQGVVDFTVFWEAWGGSDITVAVTGEIREPAATGTVDYTVTGFTSTDSDDQVVMFAGCKSTQATNTLTSADDGLSLGFATGGAAGENVVLLGQSDNNSATMDTDGYCKTGECLAQIVNGGGNPDARAQLTQFGTDNFRLNWIAVGLADRPSIFLAMKGGNWRAGALTIAGNSANATATVSGLPFTPIGVSVIGCMTAEDAAGTSHTEDLIGIGCGSSTSSRRTMGIRDENGTSNVEIDQTIQYDQVLAFPSNTGTLQSAYDINAMNADGFQLIVDTAGGVASEWIGYLTFGNVADTDTQEWIGQIPQKRTLGIVLNVGY